MPTFAIVDTAGEHDNKRAREVCAGLEEGEVVVFDKAYVDFAHLHDLDVRSVQWVTRAKDNFRYRTVRNLSVKKGGKIVNVPDREAHRQPMENARRLDAASRGSLGGGRWCGAPDGLHLMRSRHPTRVPFGQPAAVYLAPLGYSNTAWSTGSVCDLYSARWDIEVFFKQVKQTLKLGDFLGHSFTRLLAVVRAAMWERLDMLGVLRSYGTAGGSFKMLGSPLTAWLPGFEPAGTRSHGTASA